jgi:hypothetical protein
VASLFFFFLFFLFVLFLPNFSNSVSAVHPKSLSLM